jgi:hypothetical protein
VAQLKSYLHQMLKESEEKLSKNATLMPMLVGLSQRMVFDHAEHYFDRCDCSDCGRAQVVSRQFSDHDASK